MVFDQVPGFFIALVISLICVPIVRHYAIKAGRFDTPGERKIHKYPIPRLGGVAMFAGFIGSLAIILLWRWQYPHDNGVAGILAGGLIMFVLGLLDDLYNLSPYIKLAGQFLAASVAFFLGVQITALDLPGDTLLVLNGFSFPVTVFWMMAISNAVNFIDGVDGLAGGVTTISALTLAVIAVFTHQPVAALLSALMAGSSLGFLVYNFYPARIFMGDSGALFSGFVLASIAVTGVLKAKIVVMLLPILILTVPIMDITFATTRRLFRGKNPFIADGDHIHHRMLKAGYSQMRIVLTIYGVCAIAGMLSTGYVNYLADYVCLLLGMFLLASILIVLLRFFFPLQTPELPNSEPSNPA